MKILVILSIYFQVIALIFLITTFFIHERLFYMYVILGEDEFSSIFHTRFFVSLAIIISLIAQSVAIVIALLSSKKKNSITQINYRRNPAMKILVILSIYFQVIALIFLIITLFLHERLFYACVILGEDEFHSIFYTRFFVSWAIVLTSITQSGAIVIALISSKKKKLDNPN